MNRHSFRAEVLMADATNLGFRFIDCVAEWVTAHDPEGGYGQRVETDKYGDRRERLSYVAGLVGGAVECVIYPEQFGLPIAEKGECFRFYAAPKTILDACVQAIGAELYPPEYTI